jgi:L-ascorbate metabolism protein UlaG (beta-lactamase superfamily)
LRGAAALLSEAKRPGGGAERTRSRSCCRLSRTVARRERRAPGRYRRYDRSSPEALLSINVKRWIIRIAAALGVLFAVAVAAALVSGWTAFGHRAEGARLARMQASPHYADGHFVNPQPLVNDAWLTLKGLFGASPHVNPDGPLPDVAGDHTRFETPPPSGLRVTWFGHSSLLVELDGHRILTDPVWSDRVSPIAWIGPKRWNPPSIALSELPPIDAVVISHDHYDHLDRPTIVAMKGWKTRFFVPLGVGAHLAYWGIPEDRITELDWWEHAAIGDLEITCTPARHASGRSVWDKDATLWAGWALVGPRHRAYYSGDTGLFPAMREIGEKLGPFDVTMIETGQYDRAWPDWHIGPEQAVIAHGMVRGRVLLPVHWGLLGLAYHAWTEPVERVMAAAALAGVHLVTPREGQSFEPEHAPPLERWWPDVPWQTAAQHPIVSGGMN